MMRHLHECTADIPCDDRRFSCGDIDNLQCRRLAEYEYDYSGWVEPGVISHRFDRVEYKRGLTTIERELPEALRGVELYADHRKRFAVRRDRW